MSQGNLNTILASVALFGVVVTLLGGVYGFAQMKLKVDTMWAFIMRRAVSEAIEGGLATLNSPLAFTRTALAALEPLAPSLRALAAAHPKASQLDLAFLIEQKYGEELLERFCIPFKTSHGACVLAALEIAKGAPIEISFDPQAEKPNLPLMKLHERERKM
jgi:hypothetical protein